MHEKHYVKNITVKACKSENTKKMKKRNIMDLSSDEEKRKDVKEQKINKEDTLGAACEEIMAEKNRIRKA